MTAARRRFNQEFKDELCLEVISTSKTITATARRHVITVFAIAPRSDAYRTL